MCTHVKLASSEANFLVRSISHYLVPFGFDFFVNLFTQNLYIDHIDSRIFIVLLWLKLQELPPSHRGNGQTIRAPGKAKKHGEATQHKGHGVPHPHDSYHAWTIPGFSTSFKKRYYGGKYLYGKLLSFLYFPYWSFGLFLEGKLSNKKEDLAEQKVEKHFHWKILLPNQV